LSYRLTEAAKRDLIQVYLTGLERFGLRQAESYLTLLEHAFQIIADTPEIARERREIAPPVRVHPCGSHMVIYEINESGVLILRVRHHREDWVNHPI